uniref:Carboxypeptidase n=1 Tax=Setaria digitata TaxID=48799 RepID=A0A915PNG6_9BILA
MNEKWMKRPVFRRLCEGISDFENDSFETSKRNPELLSGSSKGHHFGTPLKGNISGFRSRQNESINGEKYGSNRVTMDIMWYAVALLILLVRAVDAEDEIRKLPGAEQLRINFKHYSGYFQVSDNHHLHYWFVESQKNVAVDPLIFWFNGGPGCSSLDGLLNEMGPYLVNDDGKTLRYNSFSWNTMASIVYIESPAGVGYSFASDGDIKTNDNQTAEENYAAIKGFFKKFPQFLNHSVYIIGESYGGIYVPTLTVRVLRGLEQFPINLKGIALGNGYVNEMMNVATAIQFAYNHGLIDEKTWNTLEIEELFKFIWSGELNPYDIYRDCDPNPEQDATRLNAMKFGLTSPLFASLSDRAIKWKPQEPHIGPLFASVPCLNDSALVRYMNRAEVRHALHIPEKSPKWDVCSDQITDTYEKVYKDMGPFIKEIVRAKVRVLLYYGDTDMACNFLMGQQFSAALNLPVKRSKEPWHFDSQIAGFKNLYKGLTFLTIRGAGHMAPQWRAPQMHYVIQQFISNQPI